MKLGLQIRSFTWPGGPAAIAEHLGRIVRTADDVGFDSIWVMDHFIQIRGVGKPHEPMLEGWTTLGWIAANTRRARLGLLVGGVPYRHPAVWVKAATALDVLSGGRAWLGIGAAWNQEEAEQLGIPFPPLPEASDAPEVNEDDPQLTSMGEVEDVAPGESKSFTATLEAGSYVGICNVETHYDSGMHIDFTAG